MAMLLVVFVLLLCAMTIAPPSHEGVGIDLPKVDHPRSMWKAETSRALVIAIMRDGKIFVGNDLIATEDLPAKIREAIHRGAKKQAYIRADRRIRYSIIKLVLDGVQAAGVETIGILVDQRRTADLSTPEPSAHML